MVSARIALATFQLSGSFRGRLPAHPSTLHPFAGTPDPDNRSTPPNRAHRGKCAPAGRLAPSRGRRPPDSIRNWRGLAREPNHFQVLTPFSLRTAKHVSYRPDAFSRPLPNTAGAAGWARRTQEFFRCEQAASNPFPPSGQRSHPADRLLRKVLVQETRI